MRRLIHSTILAITLGLGIWTLAVTLTPISSAFNAGDTVSAAAFNTLFTNIGNNFAAAESAINANEAAVAGLTKPPAARAGILTNQSFNSGIPGTIAWEGEAFDNGNIHNPADNTKFTAPESGLYQISVNVTWANNAVGTRLIAVLRNNVTQMSDSRAAISGLLSQSVSHLLSLQAGDVITVRASQDSGGALTLQSTSMNFFSMVKVGELP